METAIAIEYRYDVHSMLAAMEDMLTSNLSSDAANYLKELKKSPLSTAALNTAFATASRRMGKTIISLTEAQQQNINSIVPGRAPGQITTDRLLRTWLLLYYSPADFAVYKGSVENLFLTASVGELTALYAALPLLPHPPAWKDRCAEGIRSNMGDVLEAIMYDNSYPAAQLEEAAWNQLVLKALFTGKDLNRIQGLEERRNAELAIVLYDFAHERWAAQRQAPPQLWRLVAPFITEQRLPDFKRALDNTDLATRQAAALALSGAPGPEAKSLLDQYPDLKQAASNGTIRWSYL